MFSQRERAVRAVLSLHCPLQETDESLSRERFLTRRLLVPERWLHEAKSVRARHCGDKHREALHLYRAGCWNRCHRLLVAHLAPGMPPARLKGKTGGKRPQSSARTERSPPFCPLHLFS